MTEATHIKGFRHNGKRWDIVRFDESYFARCEGSDTGPYSTAREAEDFVTAIKL